MSDSTPTEHWLGISHDFHHIHDRTLSWYPGDNLGSVPDAAVDKTNLQLQHVGSTRLNVLMPALPHWHFQPRTPGNPLPWLLIYPYHPVIDTFGHNKANSAYLTEECDWKYPADLSQGELTVA